MKKYSYGMTVPKIGIRYLNEDSIKIEPNSLDKVLFFYKLIEIMIIHIRKRFAKV